MARRRRKRERRSDAISQSPVRSLTVRLSRPLALPSPRHLVEVDDRRRHHPLDFFRPARTWSGHPTRPNVVKPAVRKFSPSLPFGTRFADPRRTVICVRRKERKEVLFALKRTGKGARARRRRRNFFSEVSC